MSKQQSHFELVVPRMSLSDVEVLVAEAKVRAEFGEDGLKRFRELMGQKSQPPTTEDAQ